MTRICKQRTWLTLISLATAFVMADSLQAENRTIDGTGNNIGSPSAGAANKRMIRFDYDPFYPDGLGRILNDTERANPRDISNRLSAQASSVSNARGVTDYIWVWGQFLDHDMDLSTGSNGAVINGTAPIAINDPQDPLAPNAIPFTRSNFRQDLITGFIREQFNEITSFIDASNVYGSDAVRAEALRTGGGTGAKLQTSTDDLLPFNTVGLPNENTGPNAEEDLFLAGDLRSNENVLLTSMHTIFVREHNRLVDKFANPQFGFDQLSDEEKYQLARKIVGAEMQVITYNEFLPALLGAGAPVDTDYSYSEVVAPDITQSFAHAAYRFGHSTVSSDLELVNNDGTSETPLELIDGFSNPGFITANPNRIDQLLKGAASVISEEVDLLVIDALRNLLFGPPGAGGLDLVSLNIQRGRDHGLPDYNELRDAYHLNPYTSFDQITSDVTLQAALEDLYENNIDNVDGWVGMLAEDHLSGSSVGESLQAIIGGQFERTRDGDRLFYLSNDAGLYLNGVLDPTIEAVIDLDGLSLSDVIKMNTSITNIQENVFFLVPEPSSLCLACLGLCFGRKLQSGAR